MNILNIAYGPSPYQTVNLVPNSGMRGGTLIAYTPGGWSPVAPLIELNPNSFLGELYHVYGFSVALIQRRPSENPGGPEVYFPQPADDLKLAIQILNGYAQKTILVAKSAGGVMAMHSIFNQTVQLDGFISLSACTGLHLLPGFNQSAAPYFGKITMGQVEVPQAQDASALHIITVNELNLATLPFMKWTSPNSNFTPGTNDPHAAWFQKEIHDRLETLGSFKSSLYVGTGEAFDADKVARTVSGWLGSDRCHYSR